MAGIGYAFISAYLKGEESRILTSEHLNAVMKAGGYQEAVDAIRDTDIGTFLEGLDIHTFEELDEALWIYFSECLNRITWFKSVPDPARQLVSRYAARYDIQNIKTVLQTIITGIKTKGIPAGSLYNQGLLDDLLAAETLSEVQAVLSAGKLAEYSTVLETYRSEDGINKDVMTDTALESMYFKNILDTVKKTKDNTALLKSFYTIIDMTNLQILLRAVMSETVTGASGKTLEGGHLLSESLITELLSLKITDLSTRLDNADLRLAVDEVIAGYEKEKNISAIDETIDKHKFRMVREILSPRIMSPAVVIWYLFLKEIEIRNVRLVLKAALDNIPAEEIRNYLVYAS